MCFNCEQKPLRLPSIHQLVSEVAPASRVLESIKKCEKGNQDHVCRKASVRKLHKGFRASWPREPVSEDRDAQISPTMRLPSSPTSPGPRSNFKDRNYSYWAGPPSSTADSTVASSFFPKIKAEQERSLDQQQKQRFDGARRHTSQGINEAQSPSFSKVPVYSFPHMEMAHMPPTEQASLQMKHDHVTLPLPPRNPHNFRGPVEKGLPSVSSILESGSHKPAANNAESIPPEPVQFRGHPMYSFKSMPVFDGDPPSADMVEGGKLINGTPRSSRSSSDDMLLTGSEPRSNQPNFASQSAPLFRSGGNAFPKDRDCPKRRGNLPKAVTQVLRTWLNNHLSHPYPSEDDKLQLMNQTGLSLVQVSNWFINARRRSLPPNHRKGKSRTRIWENQESSAVKDDGN